MVLLDVHLPDGGGAEVMRRFGGARRHTEVVPRAVGVRRGRGRHRHHPGRGRGYVTKTITGHELVDAIRRVADGDAVFSPRLAGFVLDAFAGSIEVAAVDEDLDRLTEREREVMRLIARGYAYKEVAAELFISIKTVETHVSSVLRKLQLSSRHELTRWATDRRLLWAALALLAALLVAACACCSWSPGPRLRAHLGRDPAGPAALETATVSPPRPRTRRPDAETSAWTPGPSGHAAAWSACSDGFGEVLATPRRR